MADCNIALQKPLGMMQGDSWPLEFAVVKNLAQPPIPITEIASVEVSLGDLIKKWPGGDLPYDATKNKFAFWPSQQETFELRGNNRLQVRVKLTNGALKGFNLGVIEIAESNSKEVL